MEGPGLPGAGSLAILGWPRDFSSGIPYLGSDCGHDVRVRVSYDRWHESMELRISGETPYPQWPTLANNPRPSAMQVLVPPLPFCVGIVSRPLGCWHVRCLTRPN